MKYFVYLMPILVLFCFCFYGCGSTNNVENLPSQNENEKYYLNCYFQSDEPVVLIKDTNLDTACVKLIIEGDIKEIYPEITWDKNIIDYNIETGKITAKNEGKTNICITFLNKQHQTKTENLKVEVKSPVFANVLEIKSNFVIANDKNSPLEIKPLVNENYNLGIEYFSNDESIFTVSEKGILTPVSVGNAQLFVRAVSGFNESTNSFVYIEKVVDITVNLEISKVEAEIYDSDGNQVENNILFYDKSGYKNYYYIKVSASGSLKNFEVENFEAECAVLESGVIFNGNNEFLVPIYAKSFGKEILTLKLKSTFDNKTNILKVEIPIQTYQFVQNQDIVVGTLDYQEDDLSLLKSLSYSKNGYILYNLGGDEPEKILGHKNEKYFYGLIIFDNLSPYCYNEFTISNNSNAISLTKISDSIYYVEAQNCGTASLTIESKDKNFSTAVHFEVQEVKVSNASFYPETTINLVLSENEKVNLSVTQIEPSYATYGAKYEVIFEENKPIELDKNGLITPKEVGCCFVVVTLGDKKVSYKICVSEKIVKIACTDNKNYEISKGEGFSFEFKIVDEFGQEITSQDYSVKIAFETEENLKYDLTGEYIFFEWKQTGITKFRLLLVKNERQIFNSEIISVCCK